jgi:ferredoxin-type protein NapF
MGEKLLSRKEFLRLPFRGLSSLINSITADEFIRPPGVMNEELFQHLCNGCGICKQVCPKGIIQISESDNRPYLIPSDDPCDLCMKCIEGCETGALKQPPHGEIIKFGYAEIDRSTCLTWKGQTVCNICKYRCPKGAIILNEQFMPEVDRSLCNGCMVCEYVCIHPHKSIKVRKNLSKKGGDR